MKRAVSISIGSGKRDKAVEIELLGETVRIERVGTNGDMQKAAQLFKELDGQVDAFGLGGADLGLMVDKKWYPLYSVEFMVKGVQKTPVVDGTGLKTTLEKRVIAYVDQQIGQNIHPKRALVTAGADRWGMSKGLLDAGYDCIFGDLLFALGLPFPIRTERSVKILAAILMPIAGRLPFKWIYPTGEKQETRTPKYGKFYGWASVIAGDRHYIVRYMPDRLDGKTIITNTTTKEDVELFKKAGVKYLVTTTPVFQGRSFGTNMLEAAMVAVAGKGRKLAESEINSILDQLNLKPDIQELN